MLVNRIRRAALLGATLALSAATVTALAATPAGADDPDSLPLSQVTVTGIHNTYNPADYPYLAQALDAGTGMIELDTWSDFFTQEWKVGHDSPTSNNNNCVDASTPATSTPAAPTRTSATAWTTCGSGWAPTPAPAGHHQGRDEDRLPGRAGHGTVPVRRHGRRPPGQHPVPPGRPAGRLPDPGRRGQGQRVADPLGTGRQGAALRDPRHRGTGRPVRRLLQRRRIRDVPQEPRHLRQHQPGHDVPQRAGRRLRRPAHQVLRQRASGPGSCSSTATPPPTPAASTRRGTHATTTC